MLKSSAVLTNKRPILWRKFKGLNNVMPQNVEIPKDPEEALILGFRMGLKRGWGKGLAEGVGVGMDVGMELSAVSDEPFDLN